VSRSLPQQAQHPDAPGRGRRAPTAAAPAEIVRLDVPSEKRCICRCSVSSSAAISDTARCSVVNSGIVRHDITVAQRFLWLNQGNCGTQGE
jgi:hypothetical protein